MTHLNWAILGLGSIATEMAAALQEAHGTIYAVASRSQAKANTFASAYDVTAVYGSYEAMLTDENIDVVYIATPHSNHYEYIIASLHHNKHVLCEKAITVNTLQLAEITALAKEKQLIVAEAMTIFHMPLFKKIKQLINKGDLGTLKMIQASFGSVKENDVSNRFFDPALAGGALLDIGTYAVSFARYFLSSQPTVIKTTMLPSETGIDEQSGILLQTKEGEIAVINLSIRAKMPKTAFIGGDKGYFAITDYPRGTQASFFNTETGTTTFIESGRAADAFQYEIDAFETAVTSQQEHTLALSNDVISILTEVRQQWGMSYPFEK